jgi:DNA-binding transcriptional ArsR family regulator
VDSTPPPLPTAAGDGGGAGVGADPGRGGRASLPQRPGPADSVQRSSNYLTIFATTLTLKPMLEHRPPIETDPTFDADRAFQALGDPTRRWIVDHLSRAPSSASRMAEPLGLTTAAVVQHLQVLEESGLVRSEKRGRVRTCVVDPRGMRGIERWISERRVLWERRLDRLGEILAEGGP